MLIYYLKIKENRDSTYVPDGISREFPNLGWDYY